MWLRLTARDGDPILVNMDRATEVYPTWRPGETGSLVFFASTAQVEDGSEKPTEVRETIDEIEGMIDPNGVQARALRR